MSSSPAVNGIRHDGSYLFATIAIVYFLVLSTAAVESVEGFNAMFDAASAFVYRP